MFRGATALNLDAKGRLAVPSKHREALHAHSDGRLVLTAHPHRCLLLYPSGAWAPIEEKIMALPSFEKQSSALQRLLVGHAEDLEMDASGRLLVSAVLRNFASLDKEVMFVGQGTHFELWSADAWGVQLEQAIAGSDASLPDQLGEFSL